MNWFKSFWKGLTEPHAMPVRAPAEGMRNFTPRAQETLTLARKEAARFNHNFVGTEHVLLGLIRLGQGTAVTVMKKTGLNLEMVREEVEKQIGIGPEMKMFGLIPYTPRVKKVLALAMKEARGLNQPYVGTEHILLGLLREGDGVAGRILKNLNVDLERTREEVLKIIAPNSTPEHMDRESSEESQKSEPPKSQGDWVDTSKQYDIYCAQQGDELVVYRNARFKGKKKLFPSGQQDLFSEFLELEQSNGESVFVARISVIKFCAAGVNPSGEASPGKATS